MSLSSRVKRVQKRVHTRVEKWQHSIAKAQHTRRKRVEAIRKAWRNRRKATSPAVMYDAVTTRNIPSKAKAVAGYVGGAYANFGALVARFPQAQHVSIAVNSSESAEVLDVEPGDATIPDAPGWWSKARPASGRRPGFYCSISSAQELISTLAVHGIPRSQYRLWTAHYTDHAHICDASCGFGFKGQADATQWTTHDNHVDESRCAPSWWK